ncbi:MAG TPA: LuxR C-terminal-related transcriptional regulator [Pirellulales bacterium]|jgi:DNA-binding CsgD family transcriptional regulator|nr:LuxR C-terminal-related transcriptional regulator [Pirellulales bacterium]
MDAAHSKPTSVSLPQADIEAIVDLVADVGNPTHELGLVERRRKLAAGLVRLIEGDTFFWSFGYANPDVLGDAMPTSFVDGGWKNQQERDDFFHLLMTSKAAHKAASSLTEHIFGGNLRTIVRNNVISDAEWPTLAADFHARGIGEFLMSMYPLGGGGFSAIGIHRRLGKPAFAERERAIVHIVFQNVDWIHRDGADLALAKKAVRFAPREREVLLLLLRGDSQKLIASKLDLSQHTVGDYMKQIYRHFDVNSRGELLGRFIAGSNALD